jgi:hypothetical protein
MQGLPQSATGQTTLLTGTNAALLLGRHLNGYPNRKLKDLLARESIFLQLERHGLRSAFANCYQPRFFNEERRRISVTTTACLSAGIRLNTIEDLQAGRAIYQDFTNQYLISRGHNVDPMSPEQAGTVLAAISTRQDFTLYEFFITDLAGHARDWSWGIQVAENLDCFLLSVLEHLDLERQTMILCSDHGNFEDFSTRSHTRNPVFTIAWGHGRKEFMRGIRSIQDITPALVRLLTARTAIP